MHNVRKIGFFGGRATLKPLLNRTSKLLCGSVAVGAMVFASRADAAGCIVSGSTERECASIAYEVAPTLVMVPEGDLGWGSLQDFDSWIWGLWYADPLWQFRSDPPSGFSISIR